ncbi:SpaA isopeptide-forming pilin-related protein [Bifidobacterium pongonis]|uniref:SpaA isopeptide-forming pilin-related protein n=1 Tax=Bifidobacterium pongonis TaxID=2834432 RepID=UPI001F16963D|nr:isopeptide-forming domain-containing fimbrial protein [Bifidobacterium pongonis]
MKKLFAGIVAAATLMGGLALGAASAHAAETVVTDKATFTFTADHPAQLRDRAVDVYKIGDYVKYGDGAGAKYGVRTTSANKEAVDAALSKALGAEYGKKDVDNLSAAIADGKLDRSETRPWDAGTARKFADELKAVISKMTAVAPTPQMTVNGTAGTFELPAGIYLFNDTSHPTAAVTQAVPMIVASGKVANGMLTEPTAGATVNFKSTKNTPHTKEVKQKTSSVGDVLDYTLKGKVSIPKPDSFAFTDQPGVGLTVKTDSFSATVDGKAVNFSDYFDTDFRALKNGTDGNGEEMFTVTAKTAKLDELAGKPIEVSYKALVNTEAKGMDTVVNKVVTHDPDSTEKFHTVPTQLLEFEFTKVNKDGAGIEGATFKLSVEKDQTGSLPVAGGPEVEATSGKDGKVKFDNLKAGTYTVTETKVANGQYQDIKAAFTIDLKEDGTYTITKNAVTDPFDLVNAEKKTVLNVRNITELPLTGAAGTALFTVIALLLGGAGVAIVLKSRSVKNTPVA